MIASQAFHRESNGALKRYALGALGFGLLTVLALLQIPGFREIHEQLLSPQLYLPLLIAATLFFGAVLICATRRPSLLRRFVAEHERPILHSLAWFCGGIFGWALAVCLLHVTINDPSSAPQAVGLASLAAILTLFPVWAFTNVLVISKAYREFTVREKRWPLLIPISGWAMIALSVFFAGRLILIT